jgi:hypothetical protein
LAINHYFFIPHMTLEQGIITPSRLPHEPEIQGNCLFLVNPFEAHYAATAAKARKGHSHRLFHCQLMAFTENAPFSYWAGPAVGAPMAVLTMEKLIATRGVSEEGVSAHYPLDVNAQTNSPLKTSLLTSLAEAGLKCSQGPIWTTDAPYRELPSKIKKFAAGGIMAVDMEFSALCTVAAFRQIELAAVMLVSDELYHNTWQPGYTGKSFKKKSRALFDHLSILLPNL